MPAYSGCRHSSTPTAVHAAGGSHGCEVLGACGGVIEGYKASQCGSARDDWTALCETVKYWSGLFRWMQEMVE